MTIWLIQSMFEDRCFDKSTSVYTFTTSTILHLHAKTEINRICKMIIWEWKAFWYSERIWKSVDYFKNSKSSTSRKKEYLDITRKVGIEKQTTILEPSSGNHLNGPKTIKRKNQLYKRYCQNRKSIKTSYLSNLESAINMLLQ